MTTRMATQALRVALARTSAAIQSYGDHDECEAKHIGHSLAAIIATGSHTNAIDYQWPADDPRLGAETEAELLAAWWGPIERWTRQHGGAALLAAVADEWYAPIFHEQYYGSVIVSAARHEGGAR